MTIISHRLKIHSCTLELFNNLLIFRLPAVIITFLTLIGMNLGLNVQQMKMITPIQNLKSLKMKTSSLLLRKRKMTVKKIFH